MALTLETIPLKTSVYYAMKENQIPDGRWETDFFGDSVCSNCHRKCSWRYPFCPHCGARQSNGDMLDKED